MVDIACRIDDRVIVVDDRLIAQMFNSMVFHALARLNYGAHPWVLSIEE